MLAHVVFRNLDGSFTPAGWYWLLISGWVLLGSTAYFIAPGIAFRLIAWQLRRRKRSNNSFLSPGRHEAWKHSKRAHFVVRLASAALGCGAIWFASMAITAAARQLV